MSRSHGAARRYVASLLPPGDGIGVLRNLIDAMPLRLVLYQPEIPQNTGTMLRMCACMGVTAVIIGPAGFPFSHRAFRRAGLDYLDRLLVERHTSFGAFETWRRGMPHRLVLLTTGRGATSYADHAFDAGDLLMVGRESAGVPAAVHASADVRLTVPMVRGVRSLNVAAAAAMVLGEALRQTGAFPHSPQAGAAAIFGETIEPAS
jgi:tRNA (cytidine/uridine-2'-O-)-methyltransferase